MTHWQLHIFYMFWINKVKKTEARKKIITCNEQQEKKVDERQSSASHWALASELYNGSKNKQIS
jgi:hypothetical protein